MCPTVRDSHNVWKQTIQINSTDIFYFKHALKCSKKKKKIIIIIIYPAFVMNEFVILMNVIISKDI